MYDKIKKEKEFHNIRFEKETRNSLNKYYSISHLIDTYFKDKLESITKGKRVLEYGCGLGSESFELIKIASEVHAIDISDVAIAKAKKIAAKDGINNIFFYVMDAEKLDFEDNYFDVIFGSAILHHLDLKTAYSELSRVLKPNGILLFKEPLGHNIFINLFRRLTMHLRTEDEHPLLMRDIDLLDKYFETKEVMYFFLTSLFAVIFRNRKSFEKISYLLNKINQKLFKFNFFKSQAWMVVLEASHPR